MCPNLEEQLALRYRDPDSSITSGGLKINHIPVQLQRGTSDCGLFAIAFALHAALGDDLRDITFDQSKLRSHLLWCFTNNQLTPFPITSSTVPRACGADKISFISLYCHCRRPESYDNLVLCEQCNSWFHHKCVQFDYGHSGNWYCNNYL